MSDKKLEYEIENLNLDDLDVQELEARLELAVAAPAAASDCNSKDCSTLCNKCDNCYGHNC